MERNERQDAKNAKEERQEMRKGNWPRAFVFDLSFPLALFLGVLGVLAFIHPSVVHVRGALARAGDEVAGTRVHSVAS